MAKTCVKNKSGTFFPRQDA